MNRIKKIIDWLRSIKEPEVSISTAYELVLNCINTSLTSKQLFASHKLKMIFRENFDYMSEKNRHFDIKLERRLWGERAKEENLLDGVTKGFDDEELHSWLLDISNWEANPHYEEKYKGEPNIPDTEYYTMEWNIKRYGNEWEAKIVENHRGNAKFYVEV